MKKFKTTGFWVSLTGAIILVLQQLGTAFNFNVNSEVINGVVSAGCSVMVVLGILIPSKKEDANKINGTDETNNEE